MRKHRWATVPVVFVACVATGCGANSSRDRGTTSGDAGTRTAHDGGPTTTPSRSTDATTGPDGASPPPSTGTGSDGGLPPGTSGDDAGADAPAGAASWQRLRAGAGGFLSGMDIASDGTMVVRTDTYGAYLLDGTQWRQIVDATSLPQSDISPASSGGVYELRIAPSATSTLYMTYNGYVYTSTNQGSSWTRTTFAQIANNANDNYRGNGQKMAIDPIAPNVVYVGTPQTGLFVTADSGNTWQAVSGVASSQADSSGNYPGITGIAFDASSGATEGKTGTIYASSFGNGVYQSTNAGASWTAIGGGPTDVEFAVVSGGAYYATGNNDSSLWRFQGGSWTKLLSDSSGNVHSVAIDPSSPTTIVVQAGDGGLNVSSDGGKTWTGKSSQVQLTAADVPWLATTGTWMTIGATAFDPLVSGKLWASAGVGVWNTMLPSGLPGATVTWSSQSAGIEQLCANEVIVPPGGSPVVAGWDQGTFYVSDPDTYPANHYPGHQVFAAGWSLDYAASDPTFVVGIVDWSSFGGQESSGYSHDGGKTWTAFPSSPPGAGTAYMGGSIAASSPTNVLWSPSGGEEPYYTIDGGMTWSPVTLPGISSWSGLDYAYYLKARNITADRVTPGTFYLFFAGNGLYRTSDGGATWTQAYAGDISASDGYNAKLAAVPGQAGNLFFTGGPLSGTQPVNEPFMRSTDGGTTWTAIPNVIEVYCFGFGAPQAAGGYPAIYVVGYVNNVYGVWQSDDNAESWTQIGTYPLNSLDTIETITGDMNVYGRAYVGFGGSGYAYFGT